MTCEDCRAHMPDYWEGTLEGDSRAVMETHLASCALCRTEAERLSTIWNSLGEIPMEQPARAVRARFYATLDSYQRGFAEAGAVRLKNWWTAPAFVFAVSMGMLVVGFAAGFLVNEHRDNTQIAQLHGEVTNMRQMVALSLLQQQGASDRLKGVNWAYRVEQPDTEVLAALLRTVNHDPNVNVRLAAVDALRTYADSPVARRGMLQAIGKQDSPLVQIALIDELVDLRDRAALPDLQRISTDNRLNTEVRQRAQWALGRLQ